ncbi:MAG: DUF465 domain-containing protein [Akkermansiaceae bacterium]|nr:DUF465 domain-containing protein [Akkermansiaceae bacterium]
MLSEHHDIAREFPDLAEVLATLRTRDAGFDELVTRHDALDNEIRELEEQQQPISDEEIEKLKFERAALKDDIFQRLAAAKAAV